MHKPPPPYAPSPPRSSAAPNARRRLTWALTLALAACALTSPAAAQEPDPSRPQADTSDGPRPYIPGTPQPGRDLLDPGSSFRFGGYGRVQPATDLQGGAGKRARIVYPSPRIDEGSYTELEFAYRAFEAEGGLQVDTVTTIAFTDDIFHYTGDFSSTLAVRNLFAEARNVLAPGLFVWAGSRMYRGDDVYLIDFWPLDNLNTYGGGAGWSTDKMRLAWHAGVNRLNNDYQLQTIQVPDERGIAEREVLFLDRQRLITSLKWEQLFYNEGGGPGFKYKLYGEFHHIPEGQFRQVQPTRDETLPSDYGWIAGAQLGAWSFIPGAKASFVNLFLRYASGMAAYGEFSVPFGVAQDKRAAAANQYMVALSGNIDTQWFGVMYGGYARYFTDADGQEEDFDDGWDGAFSVRPMAFLGRYFTPGVEVSVQAKRPNGNNPASGRQQVGTIWKASLLPAFTFGEGMYARPQLRLNYTVSFQDEAARLLYAQDDPLRGREVVHFLGFAVEWWFSSSSYQ
jgi:maltoporin